MLWWQALDFSGHVNGVLAHLNEARGIEGSATATRICELHFHALNRLWNARSQHEGEPARADTPAFIALVQSIHAEDLTRILRKHVSRALATLEPSVMDHHTLKSRGYRPGVKVSDADRRAATEKHRELQKAHDRWSREEDIPTIPKKLAEFLFVVRSNIAHGEKTPYGPDFEKARRDEEVSSLVVPVQKAIIDAVLDHPEERLVAYGTLMPGRENASLLADVEGEWTACRLRGSLRDYDGLPGFTSKLSGAYVDAMLFAAPGLASRWPDFDRFEGVTTFAASSRR